MNPLTTSGPSRVELIGVEAGSRTDGETVSIVIPTRNRRVYLARLLHSIDELSGRQPLDVVVVLGPSSDGSADLLRDWGQASHRFETRVVHQEKGLGPGAARNLGLSKAQGNLVAFTDDDCIVHQEWLEYLPRSISLRNRVVGVGGRVLPLRGDWISRYYTYYRILEPPLTMQYLVTANCAVVRQEALRVGGFDGRIPTPGGEDIALSIKLQLAGWRFSFEPQAVVTHEFRCHIGDFVRTFRNYGRGCREATDRLMRGVTS
jgi:glycosyltransferase involved in cell wall biosynthesis